jgi:4-hydroxy-3-polyprenylbenzoate decarboxylase
MSGASCIIYGIRLPQTLREVGGIKSHLIISKAADITLPCETDLGQEMRRAADVTYSLLFRETPFTSTHIMNMLAVTKNGSIIVPPVPAFNTLLRTSDIIDHTVGRTLDLFGIDTQSFKRWGEKSEFGLQEPILSAHHVVL